MTLLPSLSREPAAGSPTASVLIKGVEAGQAVAVDLRLPIGSLSMGRNAAGASVPFTWLTAAVNVEGRTAETQYENNVIALLRYDIAMVEGPAQ